MSKSPAARWREENPEKVKEIRRRYYERNRERIAAAAKIWREANPEKTYKNADLSRHNHYLGKYGISLQEYTKLLESQGGLCALCLQPETAKGSKGAITHLSVDHCHTTGKIRGLLCRTCNSALGKFKDSKEILERAIIYLDHGREV